MPTMGLEIEIPNVPENVARIARDFSGIGIRSSDDGSIRDYAYTVAGTPIMPFRTKKGNITSSGVTATDRPYGLELVTDPYDDQAMETAMDSLVPLLKGIKPFGDASIHVHMDVAGKSWRFVQNFLHWVYKLEAPIYRLASLGIDHRGVKNDYKFYRPLSAPIGIHCNGNNNRRRNDDDEDYDSDDDSAVQAVRRIREREARRDPRSQAMVASFAQMYGSNPSPEGTEDLIKIPELFHANSASEMVAAWGRLDTIWGNVPHYLPHRLHCLNLVPLCTQGTIEFRLFNGVYAELRSVVRMARGLYRLAEERDARQYPYTYILGSEPDGFDYMHFQELTGVDVKRLWRKTKWAPTVQMRARPSHYSRYYWETCSIRNIHQIMGGAGIRPSPDNSRGISTEDFIPYWRS